MTTIVTTQTDDLEQDTRELMLQSAQRTLFTEIRALSELRSALESDELAEPWLKTIALIRGIKGRVLVTGMGKSGLIARKIAATMASTGTPTYFVHPSEASHGDLGMITPDDVVLALSWSGETAELANILNFCRRFQVPLIAMTSKEESALGRAADVVLKLPVTQEACPHGLAPTASTTMQLVLGDALAVALLESRGFTPQDFRLFHPGGKLGATLQYVGDHMHTDDNMPLAHEDMPMSEGIVLMSAKGFGCLGVVDEAGILVGIITDGDLRRHLGDNLLERTLKDVMTPNPKTVTSDMVVGAALERLNSLKITALFVVDDIKPVGIIRVHDLVRIGVI